MSEELFINLEGEDIQVTLDVGALQVFNAASTTAITAATTAAQATATSALVMATAVNAALPTKSNISLNNIELPEALVNPGVASKDYALFRYGDSNPLPPNDSSSFMLVCDERSAFSMFRQMRSIGAYSGDGNDGTLALSGISQPIMVSLTSRPFTLPMYRGTNTQYVPNTTNGPYYTITYSAQTSQSVYLVNPSNTVTAVTVAGVARTYTVPDATHITLSSPATLGQAVVISGQILTPQRKRDFVATAAQTDFTVSPAANVDQVFRNNAAVAFTVFDATTIRLTVAAALNDAVTIRGPDLFSDVGVSFAPLVATLAPILDAYGKFTYPNAAGPVPYAAYDPAEVYPAGPRYDVNYAANRLTKYAEGGWTQNALKSAAFINGIQRRESFYSTDRGDGIAAGLVFTDMVGSQVTMSMEGTVYGRIYGGHYNVTIQPGPGATLYPAVGAADGQALCLEMEMNNASYSPAVDLYSHRKKTGLQIVGVGGDVNHGIVITHDRGTGAISEGIYIPETVIRDAITSSAQVPFQDSGYLNPPTLPYAYNVKGKYVDVGGSWLRWGDIYRHAPINGYMVRANGHLSPRHSAQVVEHVLRPNGSVQNIYETNFTNVLGSAIYQEYLFTGVFAKSAGVEGTTREFRISNAATLADADVLFGTHTNYANFLGTEANHRVSIRRSTSGTNSMVRVRANEVGGASWVGFRNDGVREYSLGYDNANDEFRVMDIAGLTGTPRFVVKGDRIGLFASPSVTGGTNQVYVANGTSPSAVATGFSIYSLSDVPKVYRNTVGVTSVQLSSGTYTAGAPTPTGYIVMYTDAGVAYRIPAVLN